MTDTIKLVNESKSAFIDDDRLGKLAVNSGSIGIPGIQTLLEEMPWKLDDQGLSRSRIKKLRHLLLNQLQKVGALCRASVIEPRNRGRFLKGGIDGDRF